ncbi:MAG: hypothetical protein U1D55_00585 [Phycisphaerae bacterium]
MKKGLNLVEQHLDKAVLGLAGVFLLLMVWWYGIGSPNKVQFDGKTVGPGELEQAVLERAKGLETRVRSVEPEPYTTEQFSKKLKSQHDSGILAAAAPGAPGVPPALPRAAAFGKTMQVLDLGAEEDKASIHLVTPLRPSQPVLRTGRSLAIPREIRIDDTTKTDAAPPEPVEMVWVTAAAYFDRSAQQNEMTKAGYPPFRSKVYVAGIDMQRQEMKSTGEFGEWVDVPPGKVMPEISLPEPVFDDQTGAFVNKEEIDDTFGRVRDAQDVLMQTPFFPVQAGDEWEHPELPGFEPKGDEDQPAPRPKPKPKDKEEAPRGPRGGGQMGPGAMGVTGGGGGKSGGGRGAPAGGGGKGGGASGAFVSGAQNTAAMKEQAQKQAREDLAEAEKAFKAKDYMRAGELARNVANNEHASNKQKQDAEKLVADIDEKMKKDASMAGIGEGGMMMGGKGGGGKGGGGGNMPPAGVNPYGPGSAAAGGGKGGGMAPSVGGGNMAPGAMTMGGGGGGGGGTPGLPTIDLVANPETGVPAVWVHDDSVTAGKTYRYRMRVKLWNRYVGRMKALANPEDAKKSLLVGDWSPASDPITVRPSSYFFVTAPALNNQGVSVDVFKWRGGKWIKQRFSVNVGDVIGNTKKVTIDKKPEEVDFSTGAVVLDIRNENVKVRLPGQKGAFSYRDRPSLVVAYLDPADGQVRERVLEFDRADPEKKRLDEAVEAGNS